MLFLDRKQIFWNVQTVQYGTERNRSNSAFCKKVAFRLYNFKIHHIDEQGFHNEEKGKLELEWKIVRKLLWHKL